MPYWYTKRICRVHREEFQITIYSDDLSRVLTTHDVTWSRKDSFCDDQYSLEQPEELPTAPVKEKIYQIKMPATRTGFEKFNFAEVIEDE